MRSITLLSQLGSTAFSSVSGKTILSFHLGKRRRLTTAKGNQRHSFRLRFFGGRDSSRSTPSENKQVKRFAIGNLANGSAQSHFNFNLLPCHWSRDSSKF